MKKWIWFLVIILGLVSCGPTDKQIHKAIEKTNVAIADITVKAPTATKQPTNTPLPSSTQTPTSTPIPTITPDIRVISDDPMDFLLTSDDLPKEGKYFQPGSDFIGMNTNEEIIQNMENDKGREFVERTGRQTAWFSIFTRGENSVNYPEIIGCVIEKYNRSVGAQLALSEYNQVITLPESNLVYIEENTGLGEKYLVYGKTYTKPDGTKGISRTLEFTYKNILVIVNIAGKENEVNYDFLLLIAKGILEKLRRANLELLENQ